MAKVQGSEAVADLRRRAQALRDHANAVESQIDTLSRAVDSLVWMGQRKDRFTANWDDTLNAMRGWVGAVRAAAQDVDDAASKIVIAADTADPGDANATPGVGISDGAPSRHKPDTSTSSAENMTP